MIRSPVLRSFAGSIVGLIAFASFTCLCLTIWTQAITEYDSIALPLTQNPTPTKLQDNKSTPFSALYNIFDNHSKPLPNGHISPLLNCHHRVNNVTNAIRLPNRILKISMTLPKTPEDPTSQFFNPTLIPLPPYSPYPYMLLSRLVTAGLHQESHICFAMLCTPRNTTHSPALSADTRVCDKTDAQVLGSSGGIRCATAPQRLNIPPTPAYRCEGAWAAFPDIPGFHDPRVFWSGMGEPLVIVNSGSRYACVGLWIVDLRAVYTELDDLMGRKGSYAGLSSHRRDGKVDVRARMSYPHLTELTRNPRSDRGDVEKNWILFFPKRGESWIQYDLVAHGRGKSKNLGLYGFDDGLGSSVASVGQMEQTTVRSNVSISPTGKHDTGSVFGSDDSKSTNITLPQLIKRISRQSASILKDVSNPELAPSRTFAKLFGAGYTTTNLTSADEEPCLSSAHLLDSQGNNGHWHQGSNSLRLILCSRQDTSCQRGYNESKLVADGKVVHFAVLHRKFSNKWELPMRYERYFMVWEARYPFRMLGISRYPVLFAGERAQPWSDVENVLQIDSDSLKWRDVYFMYTPSLAWAWRRANIMESSENVRLELDTGHLDDEVVIGVGMDDVAQGFVKVKAQDLLTCLRECPGFHHKE